MPMNMMPEAASTSAARASAAQEWYQNYQRDLLAQRNHESQQDLAIDFVDVSGLLGESGFGINGHSCLCMTSSIEPFSGFFPHCIAISSLPGTKFRGLKRDLEKDVMRVRG